MTVYRWTEYGVRLAGGVIAAADTRETVMHYAHGWPVCRTVTCTPGGQGGDATVEIGPWVPLAGAA